jgi:hypothetical protein
VGQQVTEGGSGDARGGGAAADPRTSHSFEPVIEPVNEPIKQHPACAVKKYAFEGVVVRLNDRDFSAWKKLFPKIDLVSELQRYDLEFSHEKPKSWFSTLSAKLKYQNDRATERAPSPIPTIQVSQSGYVFIN